MKWVEIIELRSIEGDRERLASQLLKLISEVNLDGKKQAIKAYSHVTINSDFCIQLLHNSRKADAGGSRLGLHLVSELKAFGLINHSIWIEMRGLSPLRNVNHSERISF